MHQGKHSQFNNDKNGFRRFLRIIENGSHCVMEATGVYHLQLATFLYESGVKVSVVNPLRIKRFSQMKLRKNKTDKADAEMIALFGYNQKPALWSPSADYIIESRDLFELKEIYIKHRTALKNRLHAVLSKGKHAKLSKSKLGQSIKHLDKQIGCLERELLRLLSFHERDLFSRLQSIPGMGEKTSMFMILLTDGFKHFENAKQLSSFIGMAPVHRQSGSSVRGRSRISKQGNPKMRNLLFMCSFNACKYNKPCKELYERIVAKGKGIEPTSFFLFLEKKKIQVKARFGWFFSKQSNSPTPLVL